MKKISLFAASALLAACSNPPSMPDASDARTDTRVDAQPPQDTGVPTDTGVVTDTGVDTDTGVATDSGVDMDTGVSADTGVVTDTGVATDTGVGMDTGVRTDTGVPADVREAGADTGVDSGVTADTGVGDAGAPGPELWISRVGDGMAALTNASTAVFIERRSSVNGATRAATFGLPTAMMAMNRPVTLSGTATSEGALLRSGNGRFVTLAGYATAPGLASVASSASTMVPRVVARIGADTVTNSSTTLGMAYTANNVRSAFSADGTSFYVSGNGMPGGVHYQPLAAAAEPINVLAMPTNTRIVSIFGGQLYASASTAPNFYGVFAIGTGTPTAAGAMGTPEPGFPTMSGPSSYGFVAFDRNSAVPGIDVLYVADDRSPAMGGGIQRWTRATSGGPWALAATFNADIMSGVRGLAAWLDGTDVVLVAVTGENPSRVVRYVDRGMMPGAPTVLATAPMNTQFRGVALAPAM